MYLIYFILEWHSTCFRRSFCLSSGVQDCTYSNSHMSNKYCCLLASGYEMALQMHQCIKFILFWNDTLHVSDSLSVHHQEFKTVHTATGICQTDTAVCLLAGTRWNCRCTNVSNLFYFGMTLYMFRTLFPSIIRSSRLYIWQQTFVKQILLSAC